MCGIVGAVWGPDGKAVDQGSLVAMTNELRHRGPDDSGYFLDRSEQGGVALGHRRLSIIDLESGQQPIGNEDGTIQVIFNGEIYNFAELRHFLIGRGHKFRTSTDTEVLVHLYEEFGDEAVSKLTGMFAFAIWDDRNRKLLLARDRMGQKPLVFRCEDDRILFASQASALLDVADGEIRLDTDALFAYLRFLSVPQPLSIFEGFAKLPPGHYAVYRDGRLGIHRYWQPEMIVDTTTKKEDFIEEVRATVSEAVKSQMISDVPIGSFLSGGIDSSIVSALMAQHASDPINTFSIRMLDRQNDESSFAKQVAAHIHSTHHEFKFQQPSLNSAMQMLGHFDEPFADSSALPTCLVSKSARQFVKVVLSGDGADELFGGYPVYRNFARFDRYEKWIGKYIPRLAKSWILKTFCNHGKPGAFAGKIARFLAENREHNLYREAPGAFQGPFLCQLLGGKRNSSEIERELVERFSRLCQQQPHADMAALGMWVHQQTYLPDDVLQKVDLASMTYGLECRSPFLDHRVVELANRIPTSLKVNRRSLKHVLREAFKHLLPPSISIRGKQGFAIPLATLLRTSWKDEAVATLRDRNGICHSLFDRQAIEGLIHEHTVQKKDFAEPIWALLCLDAWHRRYMDCRKPKLAYTS